MLTRAEFRQLFGLPKRRTTAKKTTKKTSKVGKKTATKKVAKKSAMGKTSKPKTIKIGKRLIGGKARTVYKSRKTGAKYYKKTVKGVTKRMYLGKPVRKVRKAPKKTRFGYVNSGVSSASALMGPNPMGMANGSAAVGDAKFGKRRKTATKKTVRKVVRKVRKVRKTSVGKKVVKKRRTLKPRRRKTRVGKKVVKKRRTLKPRRKVVRKVVRKTRFGLSHGRPSGLATGPYPF